MINEKMNEMALKAYPVREKFNKKATGTYDPNLPRRKAYMEGFQQAVKIMLGMLTEISNEETPEHSVIEKTYVCGKKPRWNVGDTLAYYEFYSDREGEYVLGKITDVKLDEDETDWVYTFDDGDIYDERSLLEEETYRLNPVQQN